MCLEIRKTCKYGSRTAQFHLRDNIMSQEVLTELYCPACSGEVELNPKSMPMDNGWIIEYDMELARFLAVSKLMIDPDAVRPGFVFDGGYACWQEMYPGGAAGYYGKKQGNPGPAERRSDPLPEGDFQLEYSTDRTTEGRWLA
jgi:hypothetical protein